MAIAVTVIGSNVTTNQATFTTTAPIAQGSLVVVGISCSSPQGGVTTGVTDATANVYTQAVATASNATLFGSGIYYCYTKIPLPTGTVFTGTTSGTLVLMEYILSITGANLGLDQTATQLSSAGGTSANMATPALRYKNEVACAIGRLNTSFTGWVEGAGFTPIVAANSIAFNNSIATTTAVTYAPSWTTSQPFAMSMATFANVPFSPRRNIIRITKRVF